jgi:FixJ family two-component response regulator
MAAELPPDSELFIVEDDAALRDLLARQFTLEGFRVTSFAAGAPFLAAASTRAAACVLLDVRMPDLSGLEVLRQLSARRYAAPVFMISGWGDTPVVVDAIKSGAVDFIEKPFDIVQVVGRVREAVASWSRCRDIGHGLSPYFPGHDRLTPRERDTLCHIASGASNKEIGRRLGISPRTVEVHRARIMKKLGARNAADLMRIVLG